MSGIRVPELGFIPLMSTVCSREHEEDFRYEEYPGRGKVGCEKISWFVDGVVEFGVKEGGNGYCRDSI